MSLPNPSVPDRQVQQNFQSIDTRLSPLLENVRWGNGSPEGVVTATVGTLFLRKDGGAGTTAYTKETGTGNTGWVAVGSGGGGSESTTVSDTATLDLVLTGFNITGNVLDSPLLQGQNGAYYLARGNHSGTQLASTISDFTEAAQDAALGTTVALDSATWDVAYNDAANTWTANVLDSPLLGGQAGSYYLARANHTGTQLAATVSDFSTAVIALLTDANIPDTITLSNITQITTRAHSSLSGLAADDHAQYDLLAGRAGGQTYISGTGASDNQLFESTSNATKGKHQFKDPIDLYLSGADLPAVNGILVVGTSFNVAAARTMRALSMEAAVTYTTAPPASGPAQLFRFSATLTASGSLNMGGPQVTLLSNPTIAASSGSAVTNWPVRAVEMRPNMAALAGGATVAVPDMTGLFMGTGTPKAGYTVTRWGVSYMQNPASGATITELVAHDIEDLTRGGTNLSLRSLGTAVEMRHAGPAIFGATGAPAANLSIDCAGGFATRKQDLALVNGANDDIAVTKSFVRITGPTGAFNITSIANPVDGKRVVLWNTTAFNMTITNAAGTGTAANRITTSTGADIATTTIGGIELIYDATDSRWHNFATIAV